MSEKKIRKYSILGLPKDKAYYQYEFVSRVNMKRDTTSSTFYMGNFRGQIMLKNYYSGALQKEYQYAEFFSPHSPFDLVVYMMDELTKWEEEHPGSFIQWRSLQKL